MRTPSRILTLPFLLFLFTSPLHAAPPALSGVVVNEKGAPVAGAEIVAVQMNNLRRPKVNVRADAAGRFRIAVEACGQVALKASRRDFAPAFLKADACQASPEHRFVLRPGVTASGRIAGADGKPVGGAGVELMQPGALPEPGPFRARTRTDGGFTVSGLLPGMYVLRVAHPEHPRLSQPGIDIPDGKPKVDLGGFALSKPRRVEGQVVDPEGRPVAGVRILQADSKELEIAAAPVTGPDGRFVLPEVGFGRLTLCKEGYDSAWGPFVSPSYTSHLARLTRIVLRPIPPPFRVSGRVVDGEGRPVAGARVRSGPHENGCVVVTRIDPCTGKLIPDEVVASGADGRFSLELRERMDFDFKAEAPGYLPAEQRRVPARPGETAEMELVLRRSLTVAGQVLAKDGSPAAGVRVAQFGNPRSPEAVTDARGRFRLEGIYPGRHVFQAEHPELGRALRRLEASPGAGSLDFRLDGKPERAVAGRVLGPDGKPLPGANVQLDEGALQTWSAADGGFRLVLDPYWENPDWTSATLRASHAGYASASITFRPPEAPLQGLEIHLGPEKSVAGRVLGVENPEHLAATTVTAHKGRDYRNAEVTREGRYRLGGLDPGEWTLTAQVRNGRSAPTRVLLEPGQEEVFLDLEVARNLDVRGRILEPDGTPSLNAQIELTRSGETGSVTARSDEDGRFSIQVAPGTYSIVATQVQHAPTPLESVQVTEPLDGVEIRLRPGSTLTGRIPGLPAATRASVDAQQNGVYRRAEVGPDGTYRFDNLGPGEWKLTANVYGESLRREREESVTLSPEPAEARFDFDLALGNASLSGRLGSDDQVAFADIELLSPEGDKIAGTHAGFLDSEFRFPHLRPGTYLLRIMERSSGRTVTREIEVSGDERLVINPRE